MNDTIETSCSQWLTRSQQRGGRDAAVASGRSGGNRVDQPAGGRSAGGGRVRNCGGSEPCAWYGFHQGNTCDLVGDDSVRRGGAMLGFASNTAWARASTERVAQLLEGQH